jgi:hypothetical protein
MRKKKCRICDKTLRFRKGRGKTLRVLCRECQYRLRHPHRRVHKVVRRVKKVETPTAPFTMEMGKYVIYMTIEKVRQK